MNPYCTAAAALSPASSSSSPDRWQRPALLPLTLLKLSLLFSPHYCFFLFSVTQNTSYFCIFKINLNSKFWHILLKEVSKEHFLLQATYNFHSKRTHQSRSSVIPVSHARLRKTPWLMICSQNPSRCNVSSWGMTTRTLGNCNPHLRPKQAGLLPAAPVGRNPRGSHQFFRKTAAVSHLSPNTPPQNKSTTLLKFIYSRCSVSQCMP